VRDKFCCVKRFPCHRLWGSDIDTSQFVTGQLTCLVLRGLPTSQIIHLNPGLGLLWALSLPPMLITDIYM